jgi:hypothetical protein
MKAFATDTLVLGLLSYYGNVIARGDGASVYVCLGNANGTIPAWYVGQRLVIWR